MSKVVINDQNMEALARFIGTQSRINQAIFSCLNQLFDKLEISKEERYQLDWLQNEMIDQQNIRWDVRY